ncbi:MAG: FtsQ-type POTRA domain-containing protein [Pseudomonadota bacterium]
MPEPRAGWTTPLLRALGGLLAAVVCLAALMPLFEAAGALPAVSKLEIAGDFRHLDPAQVRAQLQPELAGTLLSLDLEQVRAAAETLPWVAQARVERVWPDAVRVSLREHTPFARWGEHSLLSDTGVMFTPAEVMSFEGFPQLAGPTDQQALMAQTFRDLSAQIGAGDFAIAALTLDARGEWTARTQSGVELRLGRGDPLPKAALIAGAVTRALGSRVAEIAYVDLRYSNGFATGWRADVAKGEKP